MLPQALKVLLIFALSIFVATTVQGSSHCYEEYRDCISECGAAAPGSGGAAPLECLTSCNADNRAIDDRNRACAEQGEQPPAEGDEGEGEQIRDPLNVIPSYSIPKKTRQSSEKVSPTPEVSIRRLDAGVDIKPGETVTAGKNEILFIDFSDSSVVEVNGGTSFTYEEEKGQTTFEILGGSMRFVFEALTGSGRRVYMSSLVAGVKGTDFAVNENDGKSEVLVFDGKVEVSDLNGKNTVEVPAGYKTEAVNGGKPSKPVPIDWARLDRWFDAVAPESLKSGNPTPQQWAIFAAFMIVMLAIIYFCIKFTIKNLKKAMKKKRKH